MLLTAIIVGGAVWRVRPSTPTPLVARFSFSLPQDVRLTNSGRHALAISPDGTQMVFSANLRLYLRSIADLEARPIPGTEMQDGIVNPVFSPDSRSIVYFSGADSALKRIALSGGAAVTLCSATMPFGMSWGADGIVFGQGGQGILRVSPNGGKPERLVTVMENEVAHGPQVLPGGQAVLFTLAKNTGADRWDKAQVVGAFADVGRAKDPDRWRQ